MAMFFKPFQSILSTNTILSKSCGTGVQTREEVNSTLFTRHPGGSITRALTDGAKFIKLSGITGEQSDNPGDNGNDGGGIDFDA